MSHKILSVTFEIDAHSHEDGHFSVPAEVCRVLGGLDDRDMIKLNIENPSGAPLLSKVMELKSGREIYGEEIRKVVKKGQRIRVTASRPSTEAPQN